MNFPVGCSKLKHETSISICHLKNVVSGDRVVRHGVYLLVLLNSDKKGRITEEQCVGSCVRRAQ